jgi:hypothetical protein
MTATGPRNGTCVRPPHPENAEHDADDDQIVVMAPDSAMSRFARWVAYAPAERAPLPAIPAAWTAAEIMHMAAIPAVYPGMGAVAAAGLAYGIAARRQNGQDGDDDAETFSPAEVAILTGGVGGWLALGDAAGPLAGGFPPWVSLGYLAAAGVAWLWLKMHPATRDARARKEAAELAAELDIQRKTEWHQLAAMVGLRGSHLLKYEETYLGDRRLVDTRGTNKRASALATAHLAEHLAEIEGLPKGRVDVYPDAIAGRLWIDTRRIDPWRRPAMHPAASGELRPDAEFAQFTPPKATIREPVTIGIDPDTGNPLQVKLWDPRDGAKVITVIAKKGGGKALALDTPLPTPTGWTTMGEVQAGDYVLGQDGRPARVSFATEVMHGRPCYEVEFSDGSVITADADHLWLTEDRQSVEAANNVKYGVNRARHAFPAVRTTAEIAATLRYGWNQRLNHEVANCRPLDLPVSDLPVPPYTLGAWLGDGTSRTAVISTADPEVLTRIEADGVSAAKTQAGKYEYRLTFASQAKAGPRPRECAQCGKPFTSRSSSTMTCSSACSARWRVRGGQRQAAACTRCGAVCSGRPSGLCRGCWLAAGSLQAAMRDLGVLGGKHIPAIYLRASEDQRRALLAGLLDTDGYCDKRGQVKFSVTSRRLAEDVRDLVSTLGYTSTITTKAVKGRSTATSTAYTVQFTPPDAVFCLPRKAERQAAATGKASLRRFITAVRPVPSVPVRCIQVDNPDRLYLAGRACIPTHNTVLLDNLTERITACDDAVLIQVNLSKALEDRWWEPLSAASALDGDANKALMILNFIDQLITHRPRGGRTTRVHQPTPEAPLYVLKLDEIDRLASIPDAKTLLQLITSKCRSEGVTLIMAGQRGTAQWTGGGDVQSQVDIAIYGKFARDSRERGHVAGADANLPSMSEYGEGHPGVFGVTDLPPEGEVDKGRTFYWGESSAGIQRLIAARARTRRPLRQLEPALRALQPLWDAITSAAAPAGGYGYDDLGDPPAVAATAAPAGEGFTRPDVQFGAGGQVVPGTEQTRAKIGAALDSLAAADQTVAAVAAVDDSQWAAAVAQRRAQALAQNYGDVDVPGPVMQVLIPLLQHPDGTTAQLAGEAIKEATGSGSRSSAHRYLQALCVAGIARLDGSGRGARFRHASSPAPAGARPGLTVVPEDDTAQGVPPAMMAALLTASAGPAGPPPAGPESTEDAVNRLLGDAIRLVTEFEFASEKFLTKRLRCQPHEAAGLIGALQALNIIRPDPDTPGAFDAAVTARDITAAITGQTGPRAAAGGDAQ